VAAADQQEMTDAASDDCDMFNNSSMNESPYFVHEPSSSSGMKKSAKVSYTGSIILIMLVWHVCLYFDVFVTIPFQYQCITASRSFSSGLTF